MQRFSEDSIDDILGSLQEAEARAEVSKLPGAASY
jgi:hypothetical protein